MDDITPTNQQDKPPSPSLPLFDGPGPSRRGSPRTSYAAAGKNAWRRKKQAIKALRLIAEAGEKGLTVDEIRAITGVTNSSYAARCTELKQDELIIDSGNCRLTASDAATAVFTITPAGLELLIALDGTNREGSHGG